MRHTAAPHRHATGSATTRGDAAPTAPCHGTGRPTTRHERHDRRDAKGTAPRRDRRVTEGTALRRDADGMAVAAFVLGLVGLLVFNILLGPMAVCLAVLALRRGTRRPARALLGLGLGVADLAVLAALATANGTVSWHLS